MSADYAAGHVEYAAGARVPTRSSPFPESWGDVPIKPGERAAWIAVNLRCLPLLPHSEIRQPASSVRRRTTRHEQRVRLLELLRRREPPW
jgi:hypothetical protein